MYVKMDIQRVNLCMVCSSRDSGNAKQKGMRLELVANSSVRERSTDVTIKRAMGMITQCGFLESASRPCCGDVAARLFAITLVTERWSEKKKRGGGGERGFRGF